MSFDNTSCSVVRVDVPEQREVGGKPLPAVLSPSDESSASLASLTKWISANRDAVLSLAQESGAVLFRGFTVENALDFDATISAMRLKNMPYIGGAAVRTNVVGDRVFTANESPPSEPIPFHHEMAQVPNPPKYLFFFCDVPPASGGETPLVNSAAVFDFLAANHPDTARKLESLGVKYVRVMPGEDDPTSAIGRSWRSTFQCADRAGAEAAMKEVGTAWEWLEGDCLRTVTAPVPAVREDERTGRKTFFNSVVAAFKGWVDARNDPLKAVRFGDDSPIDAAAMEATWGFMQANKVAVPWRQGDVLLLDNRVVMHARHPFAPPRRVLASIALDPVPMANRVAAADDGGAAPRVSLNSGAHMPAVGIGFWKVPRDATADTVVAAIKAGYRHLDCACDYGNEKEVGDGIKRAIAEGLVTREQLWVTSKLWNTFHRREHVRPACERTLRDLGLDYVDLYLVHFPIPLKYVSPDVRYPPEWFHDPAAKNPRMIEDPVPLMETWTAMESLVSVGLARSIGVCNFPISLIRQLLYSARVPPAVLQVELHPLLTQQRLLAFARANNIHVTGFSPLGAGSYVGIGMAAASESPLENAAVQAIATRVGRTPAQVILRWGVQRGTSVIPKTTKAHRMLENIALFDFELSEEDMAALDALNIGRRFNDPGHFCNVAFNTFTPIYE